MAKPQKSQGNPQMKKLLIVAGVLVVVVLMFPSSPAPVTKGKGKVGQFGSSTTKKGKEELVTSEDYKIRFDDVDSGLKNSFVPILTKKTAGSPSAINGIPSSFTGGDSTWIYTGNMTIDGVPNALLENTSNSDGVFLRPGERWRKLKLVKVNELNIVLEGPNGATKTVYFVDPTLNNPDSVSVAEMGSLPPVNQGGNNQFNGNNQNQFNGGGGGRRFGNFSGPIGPMNALSSEVEITEPSTLNNR